MELRAALIGFGLAGSVFHAPLIAATPGISLATVVTRNRERADRARRQYPEVGVEASPGAILERADSYDLVVVATPNDTHVELAAAAIEAGLAVVVDKPLAPTSAAASELVELADRRGVAADGLSQPPLGLRAAHPASPDRRGPARRRVPIRVAVRALAPGAPKRAPGARRPRLAEGGGVLLDLGTHLVDQALTLFGPVREVYGEVDHRRGAPGDDDAFVALEHVCGVRSHLWASSVAAAPGPRLRVLGSRAAYLVEDLDGQEAALQAGLRPDATGEWGAEPEHRWGRIVRGDESEPVRSEHGAWPRFYEQLAAALSGSGSLPVDPRDAVTGLEVLERARRGG